MLQDLRVKFTRKNEIDVPYAEELRVTKRRASKSNPYSLRVLSKTQFRLGQRGYLPDQREYLFPARDEPLKFGA